MMSSSKFGFAFLRLLYTFVLRMLRNTCVKVFHTCVKVFYLCKGFLSTKNKDSCHSVCVEFFEAVRVAFPDMLKKPKIHLLLHLVDNMIEFGPTSAFNTER